MKQKIVLALHRPPHLGEQRTSRGRDAPPPSTRHPVFRSAGGECGIEVVLNGTPSRTPSHSTTRSSSRERATARRRWPLSIQFFSHFLAHTHPSCGVPRPTFAFRSVSTAAGPRGVKAIPYAQPSVPSLCTGCASGIGRFGRGAAPLRPGHSNHGDRANEPSSRTSEAEGLSDLARVSVPHARPPPPAPFRPRSSTCSGCAWVLLDVPPHVAGILFATGRTRPPPRTSSGSWT